MAATALYARCLNSLDPLAPFQRLGKSDKVSKLALSKKKIKNTK